MRYRREVHSEYLWNEEGYNEVHGQVEEGCIEVQEGELHSCPEHCVQATIEAPPPVWVDHNDVEVEVDQVDHSHH